MATGIPEQVHQDYFEQLHADIPKRGNGTRAISSGAGRVLSFFGVLGDLFTFTNGNPESIIAMFPCINCDPESFVGRVQKDQASNAYYTIRNVVSNFENNKLTSKTITYDIYASFKWDDKESKYVGTDKIETRTEIWKYDKDGKRTVDNYIML